MSDKIKVALIGVGNSACTLTQGMGYYSEDDSRNGLWHKVVGGYRVKDLELVGAFDVDSKKIGLDLSEAIFSKPNVAEKYLDLKPLNVEVKRGILYDEFPHHLKNSLDVDAGEPDDIVDALKSSKADVLVNLILSGLDRTSKAYAEIAIESKCCFINATPSPIASDKAFVEEFKEADLVVAGDDLMSQFGGTAFHKGVLDFMHGRGIKITRSYQLDVGGGTETLNTLDEDIKFMKREMKTRAISMELPYEFETVTGTTDYVDYMRNKRTSYYWIQGDGFLGSPIMVDIYLRTSDGPNAGNILLDVIRAVKVAKDRGEFGAPSEICGYGFKNTLKPVKLKDAHQNFSLRYIG
ncbi:MAG: L-myo-inositol-1-phosphate synthase [archaeon]|nr:L-myo-inositol-1-phosphate synthase [archaeon]MCP8305846.1 L-myo-inositol-1-phosphate synthase [archaeon]